MKVLFIARATLYNIYGGDVVQIMATAKYLRKLGVQVDIRLADEQIDYSTYDLLHVFDISRPADLLPHISKSGKPYLVSALFADFSDYKRQHYHGLMAMAGRLLAADSMAYVKILTRWIRSKGKTGSYDYLVKGHRRSIQKVAAGAAALLCSSESEYFRLLQQYGIRHRHHIVYNGIDTDIFPFSWEQVTAPRDPEQIICVSCIEGKKNQLNLIRALNHTSFRLTLIGTPTPGHLSYYKECRQIAGPNIRFIDFLPQEKLADHYLTAKVHVLPGWNETSGLSAMEAGYAGCNVVIADKGDIKEYFGGNVWYCDPGDPGSIYRSIQEAARAPAWLGLRQLIEQQYTWPEAAGKTLQAYQEALKETEAVNNTK